MLDRAAEMQREAAPTRLPCHPSLSHCRVFFRSPQKVLSPLPLIVLTATLTIPLNHCACHVWCTEIQYAASAASSCCTQLCCLPCCLSGLLSLTADWPVPRLCQTDMTKKDINAACSEARLIEDNQACHGPIPSACWRDCQLC